MNVLWLYVINIIHSECDLADSYNSSAGDVVNVRMQNDVKLPLDQRRK
jgi:hypothetical protein